MRKTLLVVTGLVGLIRLVSAPATITGFEVVPADQEAFFSAHWAPSDIAAPMATTRRAGFMYSRTRIAVPFNLQGSADAFAQAPAVRLASISLIAPFSR
jgi:hypothetical protein